MESRKLSSRHSGLNRLSMIEELLELATNYASEVFIYTLRLTFPHPLKYNQSGNLEYYSVHIAREMILAHETISYTVHFGISTWQYSSSWVSFSLFDLGLDRFPVDTTSPVCPFHPLLHIIQSHKHVRGPHIIAILSQPWTLSECGNQSARVCTCKNSVSRGKTEIIQLLALEGQVQNSLISFDPFDIFIHVFLLKGPLQPPWKLGHLLWIATFFNFLKHFCQFLE